jgi:hypothetical protein
LSFEVDYKILTEVKRTKKSCGSVILDDTRVTSCPRDAVLRMAHTGKEREETPAKQK